MVKQAQLKGYAVLAGVFALGAVAGAGASYAYAQRQFAPFIESDGGPRDDTRHLRALGRVLDLSAEQREQVSAVMEKYRDERHELMRTAMETCGKPLAEHKKKVDDEIRAVLTPEQQQRFDKLLERQRERNPWGRPPGPGPRRGPRRD